jgi:hypothetical protein
MESHKAAGLPWPCDECESRCTPRCPTYKIRDREDEYNEKRISDGVRESGDLGGVRAGGSDLRPFIRPGAGAAGSNGIKPLSNDRIEKIFNVILDSYVKRMEVRK